MNDLPNADATHGDAVTKSNAEFISKTDGCHLPQRG